MSTTEPYTEEEKTIMSKLANKPQKLQMYMDHSKTQENVGLLDAVDTITILEFNRYSNNLVAPIQDTIIMQDLRCLERSIKGEEKCILSHGASQYLIWRIADNQNRQLKQQTYMFGLNVCNVDVIEKSSDDFSELTVQFETFWKKYSPGSLFKRKIIMFPVHRKGEVFLTLVETENWPREDTLCDWSLIHFGTGDLEEYKSTVGRKILKMLDLASEIVDSGEEKAHRPNSTRQSEEAFPSVAKADKPFLLLYFLNRILTTASEFPNWRKAINEFNTRPDRLHRDLIYHRRRLCAEVMNAIDVNGTKMAKHLVSQRARIVKRQLERGTEDMDDEPPKKSIRSENS
ncbi:unnamed protein product [Caenorhabditis sp. 36 PRJEB53466]|nr:unnamed protein product [Caenorhabditis sp. 36 PRJEB53466]